MLLIGLTGSIATGKSETSKLFAEAKIPVFDADAEVHKIYENKRFIAELAKYFPTAVHKNAINRKMLSELVLPDAGKLKILETLVHPLVQLERQKFVSKWRAENVSFVIVDIPLLYETGQSTTFDYVVVVSAPEAIQRERALLRQGMTEEKLTAILARQIPDQEKRERADFVIENAGGLEELRSQIAELIRKLETLSKKADDERNRT